MLRPFRLKGPVGFEYNMHLDDALNTKKALRDLGHYRTPKHGLTPYPDEPMIEAVKSFQRESGLREDGVMKPGGPTIDALGRSLDQRRRQQRPTRGIVEGEWDWMLDPRRRRSPFPEPVFTTLPHRRPGPPTVFDVLGEVGRHRPNRPRDVLALRRALAWAGHLPRARAIDTTDADDELFGAVERFQKAARVKTDGFVGPGGETARALDNAIAQKVKAHQRTDMGAEAEMKAPNPGAGKETTDSETQVAVAQVLVPILGAAARAAAPRILQTLPGAAAGIAAGKALEETSKERKTGATPRTEIAPKVPPTPGLEPPDDKDRPPGKTESPAKPVELPDLSQPLPDVDKPTIFVHPVPPEELKDGMIIERKGNEATRKELERIRDFFRKKGWEHIAGGRFAPDDPDVLDSTKPKIRAGTEREEQHIPGPGKAFEADTRPGGHFTDLTFRDDRGRIVHIQSVDVDRNGKPTQGELDAAERIRRAEKDTDVLLIPKGAQLERNQRFRRRR